VTDDVSQEYRRDSGGPHSNSHCAKDRNTTNTRGVCVRKGTTRERILGDKQVSFNPEIEVNNSDDDDFEPKPLKNYSTHK